MASVSLCMIVRNEEDVLGRCLSTIADLVDEIIIVDTGSTDLTKEIASEFTDKIYDFPWDDDFSAARNVSFSKAACDYCMWMDADDILTAQDRQKFVVLKSELTEGTDVVMMRYNTGFDEAGNVTLSYFRERIVRNHAGMRWTGAVHEVIAVHGRSIFSECAITHQKLHPSDPDRNLRIFEKMLQNGIRLDPRQQFYYGRELYDHKRYQDALSALEVFLSLDESWLENRIEACRYCAWCLYALNQENAALASLFRSFQYDLPRAEVCCDIAYHFFSKEKWEQAAYWYRRALACDRNDDRCGFVSPDAYGYIPCIQLCVCCSRLGQLEKAHAYNEQAAKYKPDSPAVSHNRAFFASQREMG